MECLTLVCVKIDDDHSNVSCTASNRLLYFDNGVRYTMNTIILTRYVLSKLHLSRSPYGYVGAKTCSIGQFVGRHEIFETFWFDSHVTNGTPGVLNLDRYPSQTYVNCVRGFVKRLFL